MCWCGSSVAAKRDRSAGRACSDMVMAFGQMSGPPGSQFRVGHVALTMAEYFRLRSAEHRGEMMRLGIVAATHRRGGSVLRR